MAYTGVRRGYSNPRGVGIYTYVLVDPNGRPEPASRPSPLGGGAEQRSASQGQRSENERGVAKTKGRFSGLAAPQNRGLNSFTSRVAHHIHMGGAYNTIQTRGSPLAGLNNHKAHALPTKQKPSWGCRNNTAYSIIKRMERTAAQAQ